MTDIRMTAGSCGEGPARYEAGVFAMPDGGLRGVEDLTGLERAGDPAPGPHWTGDLVRGLQGALASTAALPRPFGLAASVVGLGLGALEGRGRPSVSLRATFSDGATAVIAAEPWLADLIERDRAVVRLALLRAAAAAPPMPEPAAAAPPGDPAPDTAPTPMFEYEKRRGRLRRVAIVKEPGGT